MTEQWVWTGSVVRVGVNRIWSCNLLQAVILTKRQTRGVKTQRVKDDALTIPYQTLLPSLPPLQTSLVTTTNKQEPAGSPCSTLLFFFLFFGILPPVANVSTRAVNSLRTQRLCLSWCLYFLTVQWSAGHSNSLYAQCHQDFLFFCFFFHFIWKKWLQFELCNQPSKRSWSKQSHFFFTWLNLLQEKLRWLTTTFYLWGFSTFWS